MQHSKKPFENFDRNKNVYILGANKTSSGTYIMSTFKYCLLIWMFCGKTENKSINKNSQTHYPVNL